MSIVTEEELQLDLSVTESGWATLFDSLEVWRSRTGSAGPFENLTSTGATPARFPDGASDAPVAPATGPSVVLDGKVLNLRVNEDTDVEVTFAGSDPMTFADAATQIAAQSGGLLTSYVVGSVLVIQTVATGGNAIVRVVGGEAAGSLGLPTTEPDCLSFGREPRILLESGVSSYLFVDHNGSPDYFYRTRYYSSISGNAGEFSDSFEGSLSLSGVDPGDTVLATVDLVDGRGVVSANTPVLLHLKNRGTRVNGKTVLGGDLEVLTDEDGHAEFALVRGQQFTVAIGGTDIVRDFTAPVSTLIDTFDMLDPDYSSDDAFTVQKPDLRYAVRRST